MALRTLESPPSYSIVIPVRDEEGSVGSVVSSLGTFFKNANVPTEIIVVLDGSSDNSERILGEMNLPGVVLKMVKTPDSSRGFGCAVKLGLMNASGDFIVVMMGDGSDSPEDALRYYQELKTGADCVFGSRFMEGSICQGYPRIKLVFNRCANWLIPKMFGFKFNDTTNAFKAYTREVIEGILPIVSQHFNITVELPVKAILRGYSFKSVPVSWRNRDRGKSKLKLREMGSKYILTCIYLWIEDRLCRSRGK